MRVAEAFFAQDVLDVARGMLGMEIVHGPVRLRITETEAYRWPGDTACHARVGRTPRTTPLFGPPGRAYVYLCYGIHQMLNVVTGADGQAQAVLVRAAECLQGLEIVRSRRGDRQGPTLLNGPGKVGAALAIDTGFTGQCLSAGVGLFLQQGSAPERIALGPRVGIRYADPNHQRLPWRFADADSLWVSHRRGLTSPDP